MKTYKYLKNSQNWRIVVMIIIMAFLTLTGEEVCKLSYRVMPEDINDSIIEVSSKVVAMSNYLHVGTPQIITDELYNTSKPPSIFIVIDNSGSMYKYHYYSGETKYSREPRDSLGIRFKVTKSIIDTIYQIHKSAEIGIAIFENYLYYSEDYKGYGNILKKGIGGEWRSGYYVPLLKLDSIYVVNDSVSKKGYDILTDLLEIDTFAIDSVSGYPRKHNYVGLPKSPNSYNSNSTKIEFGFNAAVDAMEQAVYPKDNQYVLFFSDGKSYNDNDNKYASVTTGEEKCSNIPTTFTYYFSPPGDSVPEEIVSMHNFIENNNYSTSNELSSYWPISADYDTLMRMILINALGSLVDTMIYEPDSVKINGTVSSEYDDYGFSFSKMFAMNSDLNEFDYDIYYKTIKTTIDENLDTVKTVIDTAVNINYSIAIVDGAGTPEGFEMECWNRDIEFYHNNNKIDLADETMDSIEIRFTETPGEITYGYSNVDLKVSNTNTSATDSEYVNLENKGNYFSYKFKLDRSEPVHLNSVIEHTEFDSIAALFKNPELPLDTLRVAIPFRISSTIVLSSAIYLDNNADGFVDSIYIKLSGKDLTQSDVDEIIDELGLPAYRNFTIVNAVALDSGIGLTVKDGADVPLTGVNDDYLTLPQMVLSGGGIIYLTSVKIDDGVAPILTSVSVSKYFTDGYDDTLIAIFSEEVEPYIEGEPLSFLKTIDGSGYSAVLTPLSHDSNRVIYSVKSITGNSGFSEGDSAWINDLAGTTVDKSGNIQTNDSNRKVELNMSLLAHINISSAIYLDNNADGFVDSIYIDIEGKNLTENDISEIIDSLILPEYRGFSILSSNFNGEGLELAVEESLSVPITHVTEKDKITISELLLSDGGTVYNTTIDVEDGVAPIVFNATVKEYLSSTHKDTLIVVLSELVGNIIDDKPFKFLNTGLEEEYNVELSMVDHISGVVTDSNTLAITDTLIFEVLLNERDGGYFGNGDSLWISETELAVTDRAENTQDDKDNPKVELKLKRFTFPFTINLNAVTPIDFESEEEINFEDLNELKNKKGMLIAALPDDTVKVGPWVELEGTLTIFDQLGNKVLEKVDMVYSEKWKGLVYVWDGVNTNGRKVGAGSYLLLAQGTIRGIDGEENLDLDFNGKFIVGVIKSK